MEKFVKLPHPAPNTQLKPIDLLVYVNIRRHDNPEHKCFPSIDLLSKECCLANKTVRNCIKNLEANGYITVEKKGRSNFYYFTDKQINFEPFSEKFLDNTTMSNLLKSFLIAAQQYFFKDNPEFWKMTYSQRELSDKINMSQTSVHKSFKELEYMNALTTVKTDVYDPEIGCNRTEKLIPYKNLGLMIIQKIQEVDERSIQNSEDIESLKEENESLKKDVEILYKKINELENKSKTTLSL